VNIYGITTCESVKKALSFFKSRGIAYTFIDLRATPIGEDTLERWLSKQPLNLLLNTKGTTYRLLRLSKEMSDEEKKSWLLKKPLLYKRPIIECDDGALLVGFDEALYLRTFSG